MYRIDFNTDPVHMKNNGNLRSSIGNAHMFVSEDKVKANAEALVMLGFEIEVTIQ